MENRKGLSAAVLKNVALITMTIDHVTAFLVKAYLSAHGVMSPYNSQIYTLGREVGRIAFVLYAFMIAEGALKTKNKIKYALRLLILAVISVIPHSLANSGKLYNPADLNIFFLLFTGLLAIYAYQWIADNIKMKAASVVIRLLVIAAACAIALVGKFEYGLMGILLIMVFYIFRNDFPKMAVAVVLVNTVGYMLHVIIKSGFISWFERYSDTLWSSLWRIDRIQFFGILAIPFLYFYNGKKGKQLPKLFYYLFYPVHLGIIALILYLTGSYK